MQLCNTYLEGYSARPTRQFNKILIWTKTKEEIWVVLFLLLFLSFEDCSKGGCSGTEHLPSKCAAQGSIPTQKKGGVGVDV